MSEFNELLVKNMSFDKKRESIILSSFRNEKIGDKASILLNDRFDSYQMNQIKIGLKRNVNVTIYASPKYNWRFMRQVRLILEDGFISEKDLIKYCRIYNDKQLNEIRLGLKARLNIESYLDPKLNFYEMFERRNALMKTYNIKK